MLKVNSKIIKTKKNIYYLSILNKEEQKFIECIEKLLINFYDIQELKGYGGNVVVSVLSNNAIGRMDENKVFLSYKILHEAYIQYKKFNFKEINFEYSLEKLLQNDDIRLLLSTFSHELEHIVLLNKYPNICNIVLDAEEPSIKHITVLYVVESYLHSIPKIKEVKSIMDSYILYFQEDRGLIGLENFDSLDSYYYALIRYLGYYIGRIICIYGQEAYKENYKIKNSYVRSLADDALIYTQNLIKTGILYDDFIIFSEIEQIFLKHMDVLKRI